MPPALALAGVTTTATAAVPRQSPSLVLTPDPDLFLPARVRAPGRPALGAD